MGDQLDRCASPTDADAIVAVIESLTDGVMVFDGEMRVRAFNSAYMRLFELEPGEMAVGDTIEEVLWKLSRRGMLENSPEPAPDLVARRVANWRSDANLHEIRRLRNGRTVEIFRHRMPDGGMVNVHVERTGREEREREIERQRAVMSSILSHIGDGVALVDESCRFIAFNDRFLELYDIPPGAVRWGVHFSELAEHFGDLSGIDEERRRIEIDRRYRFACDRSRTRVVRTLYTGRTLELMKSLLPDGGAVITMRDVTAELRRRRALDEARRRAEGASRQKSGFVAHLSHEMRNALNGILGIAALMERTDLDEAQTAQLRIISQSGRMLLRLIDDALDISRVEAETADFRSEPFRVCEVLAETLDLVAPMAREKGLALERRFTDKPRVLVLGDPVRLKQVALNILTNAIKYTREGGVTLHFDLEIRDDRAEIRIDVEDTGVGIPPEQRQRVFDEFYRIEHDAERPGGAGLGLAITHRLVTAMGGTIAIEGVEPQGTRLTVRLALPLARTED